MPKTGPETIRNVVVETLRSTSPRELPEPIDPDMSVFDYGLDSLDMSSVLLTLEERYDIKIPDEDVDSLTTVAALTNYIQTKTGGQSAA